MFMSMELVCVPCQWHLLGFFLVGLVLLVGLFLMIDSGHVPWRFRGLFGWGGGFFGENNDSGNLVRFVFLLGLAL